VGRKNGRKNGLKKQFVSPANKIEQALGKWLKYKRFRKNSVLKSRRGKEKR
jgi:hypothetical protein